MYLFIGKKVFIRVIFKLTTIIKKIDDKFLVEYYDSNNIIKYKIISESDVIEEKEYNIIKNRNNKIRKVLRRL